MHRQVRPLIALAAALLAGACRGKAAPSGPAFQVSASVAGDLSVGKPAELLTRIAAGPCFKLNPDYPVSFRPEGSSTGIRFEKQRFDLKGQLQTTSCPDGKEPKDACEARAKVSFTATEPGRQRVSGTLAFSVCNPDTCLIEKQEVAVEVDVR